MEPVEDRPGVSWLMTMHAPDGRDYASESRFTRIVPDQLFEIEHLSGHHFFLMLELRPRGEATAVTWCQTFDTVTQYTGLAEFVALANEQNLDRLTAEVARGAVVPAATRGEDALPPSATRLRRQARGGLCCGSAPSTSAKATAYTSARCRDAHPRRDD